MFITFNNKPWAKHLFQMGWLLLLLYHHHNLFLLNLSTMHAQTIMLLPVMGGGGCYFPTELIDLLKIMETMLPIDPQELDMVLVEHSSKYLGC